MKPIIGILWVMLILTGAVYLILRASQQSNSEPVQAQALDAGDHIYFVAYHKVFDPKTNSFEWVTDTTIPPFADYDIMQIEIDHDSFFGGTDRIEEVHLTDAQWYKLVDAEVTIDNLTSNAKPFQIQDSK